MKFIGVDLRSNRFNICIIDEEGKKNRHQFELCDADLQSFYKLLDKETYLMVEASTNTFSFVDLIEDKLAQLFMANTHKMKLISMVNRKTDKLDAEKLASLLENAYHQR